MKLFSSFLLLIILSNDSFSQQLSHQWETTIGGKSEDIAYSHAVDREGNIYATGSFTDTVTFKTTIGNITKNAGFYSNSYILKMNPSGKTIWVKTLSADVGKTHGISIQVDNNNDIIILGNYENDLKFANNPKEYSNSGDYDIFLLKLDDRGNFKWLNTYGGIETDFARDLVIDQKNDIYISGFFSKTVDFNVPNTPPQKEEGQGDAFILKTDPNGKSLWVKTFGGIGPDVASSLCILPDTTLAVAGNFAKNVNFINKYRTAQGLTDIFYLMLDAQGNLTYVTTFGGPNTEVVNAISSDDSGSVYLTGYYSSSFIDTVDNEPIIRTSTLGKEVFVQKRHKSGTLASIFTMGGSGDDRGKDIVVDDSLNVYVVGRFTSFIGFDQKYHLAQGKEDVFLIKLNPSGAFKWLKTLSSIASDDVNCITISDKVEMIVSGVFTETADLNFNQTYSRIPSKGFKDAFIVKVKHSDCPIVSSIDKIESCVSYRWINGISYNENNNKAFVYRRATNGCDSMVRLDLTIKKVDVDIIKKGDSLQIASGNNQFQWLKCPELSIINGETNSTFHPYKKGSYAVEVTENGCIDTSACMNNQHLSIEKNAEFTGVLYPNPTAGSITLRFPSAQNRTYQFYNLAGQSILEPQYSNFTNTTLKTPSKSGMYILKIQEDDKTSFVKVVRK